MSVRLQKYLAEAGLGSRRGCEDLITDRRVTVDGRVATLGESVDPCVQRVEVDGAPVKLERKEYWLLNKPAGVLSAVVDSRGRPTVTDYVRSEARVFPVGRLDLDSTGLLLLTNDGVLTERLLHPRYHVDKEYIVSVQGRPDEATLRRLRQGVALEDGKTSPAEVALLASEADRGRVSTLKVVLREGRKRQVRRMLEQVGHRVVALHRRRFATLTDDGLALGDARRLTDGEIADLQRSAGLL